MARQRVSLAIALASLVLLGRGEVALANANAYWAAAYNDPNRVDISDISNLAAKIAPFTDLMADARRALLAVMRSTETVTPAYVERSADGSPWANSPRAPPMINSQFLAPAVEQNLRGGYS